MYKKLRIMGLLFTVVIGVASIAACNGGGGERPYIRIDDPTFEGHMINDVAETIVDGEPLMVAVGHLGTWTSSDGMTWNRHDRPRTLTQVIKRGYEFFAISTTNQLFRSTNGRDWNSVNLGFLGRVNHISKLNAGGLLAVGMGLTPTGQYWWPAVWTTENSVDWEQHNLDTAQGSEVTAGAHQGTLLVVGGFHLFSGGNTSYPRFWYSEDNGETWASATGPFSTTSGKVQHIVRGQNNVFYASSGYGSLTSSENKILWKSTDGKTWVIVEDPEVANSGEQFSFNDDISSQSNVTAVVGSRAGEAAIWSYTRTYDTWKSSDASRIFGSEPPTTFTGIGVSANIAPGYVYTGYSTVEDIIYGVIWLRPPN